MWTDEEIMKQIHRNKESEAENNEVITEEKEVEEMDTANINNDTIDRNLILVGCGDGGCNAMSTVYNRLTATRSYAIAYNTSARGMKNINASVQIIPAEEDGSGKLREYSKEVFKKGSYKYLLEKVNEATTKMPISYIVIFTTTDGGTGSGMSPILAKLLSDNTDIPVIVVGIYPSINEDATAQFNSLEWQRDIEKINVPYMIYDNDSVKGTKRQVHDIINSDIADAMELIAGCKYGNSNISMIDNRDMLMLLANTGRRIIISQNNVRPLVGQHLDDYAEDMIRANHQPTPEGTRGIGTFLKGSSEMLKKLDTSLNKVRDTYGNATIQYTHLEESNSVAIALMMSGCNSPNERLTMMRDRYDYIMSEQNNNESEVKNMLNGISNPLGVYKKNKSKETDLSALDL